MLLLAKNVVYYVFFTNEMKCKRGEQDFRTKVIVLNATSVLIYTKMSEKRVSKNIVQLVCFNYYKGTSAMKIADMFLKIRTV